MAEEFVGRVDIQASVEREKDRSDDDQCQRQPEVILHERHPVLVRLARHRQKRDRARLRGHHGKTNRTPARLPITLQVRVDVPRTARAPDAVDGDADDRCDEHNEVERAHAYVQVKMASRKTMTTKAPITKA